MNTLQCIEGKKRTVCSELDKPNISDAPISHERLRTGPKNNNYTESIGLKSNCLFKCECVSLFLFSFFLFFFFYFFFNQGNFLQRKKLKFLQKFAKHQ